MADPTTDFVIVHDPDEGRFAAEIAGERAVLDYTLDGNRMLFTHTWVPPSLRGRGVAARLVSAALEVADDEGREVVPLCSYVVRYLERRGDSR